MRYYISGPITGISDYKERFQMAAEILKQYGHDYINPAELDKVYPDIKWNQAMLLDIALLGFADGIFFLPGAGKSEGCRHEYNFAKSKGLSIIGEEEFNGTGD